jgi:hypothetical protein
VKQSYVIEIDGVFVGAAAFYGDGYRFVGIDSRLKEMDGQRFAELSEVREAASRTYRRAPFVGSVAAIRMPAMAQA